MIPETKQVQLSQIVFDEAIYPRKGGHDPALVQKYAECIANIEAAGKYIAIATDNTLLDGKHRWLAYRTANKDEPGIEIPAFVYDVHDTHAKLALAVELNSAHGYQLTSSDKKAAAISLYNYGYQQETVAKMLSVGLTKVNAWLSDILKAKKDEENRQIWDMWLACYTETEIGEAVGLVQTTVRDRLKVLADSYRSKNPLKHLFQEEGWTRPLYNVWHFAKKTNAGDHFGNSEQRILDNLLYLYTEPLDIVVDPFAGGGSTIDVCRERGRRYWVSDRCPIIRREREIRKADILDGLPSLKGRWGEVALLYLDPPYWRQAAGEYSKDPEDLANMSLDDFYHHLCGYITAFAAKLRTGAHIAMLMQPTQWRADDKQAVDHILDICQRIELPVEWRISVPYSTEQYNEQQVNWAKENRRLLLLTREVVVWTVTNGA